MKQYLEALKNREEVSQEVLEELEERFKEPEQETIEVVPVPTDIELLQAKNETLEGAIMELTMALSMMMMGGM